MSKICTTDESPDRSKKRKRDEYCLDSLLFLKTAIKSSPSSGIVSGKCKLFYHGSGFNFDDQYNRSVAKLIGSDIGAGLHISWRQYVHKGCKVRPFVIVDIESRRSSPSLLSSLARAFQDTLMLYLGRNVEVSAALERTLNGGSLFIVSKASVELCQLKKIVTGFRLSIYADHRHVFVRDQFVKHSSGSNNASKKRFVDAPIIRAREWIDCPECTVRMRKSKKCPTCSIPPPNSDMIITGKTWAKHGFEPKLELDLHGRLVDRTVDSTSVQSYFMSVAERMSIWTMPDDPECTFTDYDEIHMKCLKKSLKNDYKPYGSATEEDGGYSPYDMLGNVSMIESSQVSGGEGMKYVQDQLRSYRRANGSQPWKFVTILGYTLMNDKKSIKYRLNVIGRGIFECPHRTDGPIHALSFVLHATQSRTSKKSKIPNTRVSVHCTSKKCGYYSTKAHDHVRIQRQRVYREFHLPFINASMETCHFDKR